MMIPKQPVPKFNAGAVPLLGQREAQAKAAIAQGVSQLSLAIYSRAAGEYLADIDQTVDTELLEQLARQSQAAAQAYFTGLGIVGEFQRKGGKNGKEEEE